jgi:diguanylate cyclase/phosphodiesterase with PAS/PAC sensor(s)
LKRAAFSHRMQGLAERAGITTTTGTGQEGWHIAIITGMLARSEVRLYSAQPRSWPVQIPAYTVHVPSLPSPAQSQDQRLTDLNHPTLLRPASPAPVASLRGSVKGALALLALILLALLLWQLFSQFRHTQADQRQLNLDASTELADHLSLNMALKAQQAVNVVQPYVKGADTRRPAEPAGDPARTPARAARPGVAGPCRATAQRQPGRQPRPPVD